MEKFNIFLFILSCLFLIREVYLFIQKLMENSRIIDEKAVTPYSVPIIRLVGLWLSAGFIITSLFLGFK